MYNTMRPKTTKLFTKGELLQAESNWNEVGRAISVHSNNSRFP